jgi:hypothetical protein
MPLLGKYPSQWKTGSTPAMERIMYVDSLRVPRASPGDIAALVHMPRPPAVHRILQRVSYQGSQLKGIDFADLLLSANAAQTTFPNFSYMFSTPNSTNTHINTYISDQHITEQTDCVITGVRVLPTCLLEYQTKTNPACLMEPSRIPMYWSAERMMLAGTWMRLYNCDSCN